MEIDFWRIVWLVSEIWSRDGIISGLFLSRVLQLLIGKRLPGFVLGSQMEFFVKGVDGLGA
jgi:hypothetical protein